MPRKITWRIHRDSDCGFDMRFFLRIERSDLEGSFDLFVEALHRWEKSRQHRVLDVRDWHADCLIISLDIGDRNSAVPAEPAHIWDQGQYEQERRRLSEAVLKSLQAVHALLVQINPEADLNPTIIHDWWMTQPHPLQAQVAEVVGY